MLSKVGAMASSKACDQNSLEVILVEASILVKEGDSNIRASASPVSLTEKQEKPLGNLLTGLLALTDDL